MNAWLDHLIVWLAGDYGRLRRGALTMVAMSLAYTAVCINLAILHGVPVPPPFLAIPAGEYFFWASFFYAPALLAGWVFGSAVCQIAARAVGGRGSFEATLGVLGTVIAIATLPALIPDLAITFVQLFGAMDYGAWRESVDSFGLWFWIVWVYLGLYIVAFVLLCSSTVRVVHGLDGSRAWLAGLVGFAAYQGFIILFIR